VLSKLKLELKYGLIKILFVRQPGQNFFVIAAQGQLAVTIMPVDIIVSKDSYFTN